ncbi:hypothetical protein D9619_012998 [Psilocybe cf. subviscida]|uniref:Mid2 domain-containing protein n=1 Tax=Psilocybe cf. subviscida TaxID=2480587 RepID=A0A8H5AZL7_9AGAR|nr:hypothetical protein D9619_012998 [Psilocybe cf. subviscida]
MLRFVFFVVTFVVSVCQGQKSRVFQWQFRDQILPTDVSACGSLPIVVKPFNATFNNTRGVPPYYMISFPVDGMPLTTLIGSDPDNLSWAVGSPIGAQILLSVVDSTGTAGGSIPRLLTVIPGQKMECLLPPSEADPSFTIKSNITATLQTCEPWGITVLGGTPPYTVTLAETDQPVVTNVTMPVGANRFTYSWVPKVMVPGQIHTVVRPSVILVVTEGSVNTVCTGEVSSSGVALTIDAEDEDAARQAAAVTAASKRRKALVIVSTVTPVFLLIIVCGYLSYRRRMHIKKKRVAQQSARQYGLYSASSGAQGLNRGLRSFGAESMPIHEKRSRFQPSPPPGELGEPQMQAPPYWEVDAGAWAGPTVRVTPPGTTYVPSSTGARGSLHRRASSAPSIPTFAMARPAVMLATPAREENSNSSGYGFVVETPTHTDEDSLPPKYRSGAD